MIRLRSTTLFWHSTSPVPVVSEDTFVLMCLVEQNEALYDDCYRVASLTLERHPPSEDVRRGVGTVASRARSELSGTLRRMIRYAGDEAIEQHLAEASVNWRDVAREIIADVLCHD